MRPQRFLAAILSLVAAGPAMADAAADSMAYYRRANAALLDGQPQVARVELLNAIKADPGNGRAHLLQGLTYIRLGNGIAAEAEIVRAREAGIFPGTTRHLMAEALLLQGDARRALDEADPADIPPRFAGRAARLRGRARSQLGDAGGAAEEFALATRLSPRDPLTWTDLGRFRIASGDALGAIEAADRAVALAPDDVGALTLKGELARSQYGLVAALPWFDKALGIDPANVPALLERAATLGEMGRTREMLAVTRAVIAIDGGNAVAFYLQAVMAARAGNFALARTLMAHGGGALEAVPAAMLLGAVIDLQTGNVEQAIGRLARLVALQPDNGKARRLLAFAQFRAGDDSGVIASLRPVADRPQADSYVLTLLGRALERQGDRAAAAVYLDRAVLPIVAANAVDDAETIAAIRRRIAADPDDRSARIALARALLQAGDVANGSDAAMAVLQRRPADPDGLILAGDAFAAQARYRDAAEAYRRAANLRFTEPVALRLIDMLRRAGNGPAAYQALALFLGQNPRNVSARLLAADLAMTSGQWRQAIEILEDLRMRLGDRDAAILSNLAWAYQRVGRPGPALKTAAAAYALAPASPAVADTYGWVLFATRADRPRGLALLEQAAAQVPGNPGVRRHLALARGAS